MPQYVHVFDMADSNLGSDRRQRVQRSGNANGITPVIVELYGMSNGIPQMVSSIRQRVASGQMRLLAIWGHGWSGGQLIAAGGNAQEGVDEGSAMWGHNLETYRPSLQQLRPLFTANGRVELRGCQVASGEAGENFMIALARIVNKPVYAATDIQGGQAGLSWNPDQLWNGPLVVAYPDGSLACSQYTSLAD